MKGNKEAAKSHLEKAVVGGLSDAAFELGKYLFLSIYHSNKINTHLLCCVKSIFYFDVRFFTQHFVINNLDKFKTQLIV
jgi:hypothetical protein